MYSTFLNFTFIIFTVKTKFVSVLEGYSLVLLKLLVPLTPCTLILRTHSGSPNSKAKSREHLSQLFPFVSTHRPFSVYFFSFYLGLQLFMKIIYFFVVFLQVTWGNNSSHVLTQVTAAEQNWFGSIRERLRGRAYGCCHRYQVTPSNPKNKELHHSTSGQSHRHHSQPPHSDLHCTQQQSQQPSWNVSPSWQRSRSFHITVSSFFFCLISLPSLSIC